MVSQGTNRVGKGQSDWSCKLTAWHVTTNVFPEQTASCNTNQPMKTMQELWMNIMNYSQMTTRGRKKRKTTKFLQSMINTQDKS